MRAENRMGPRLSLASVLRSVQLWRRPAPVAHFTHQPWQQARPQWAPSSGWARRAMTLAAQEAQQQRQQQAGAASPPPAPAALQQGQPHTAPHQTCDYTTLLAAARDLRSTLCPSKVEQALQVDAETVLLKLRTLDSSAWLQLSWHPITGHIAVVDAPPERGSAAEAFSFGAQLHSSLRGLVLSGVELPQAWERVVRLDFAARPAEPAVQQLHCEVMGRYSNVVLTDGAGTVVAAGYQVGGKMSSLRQVQAGRQYALPPPAPGIDPDACPSQAEWVRTVQLAAQCTPRGSLAEGCVRAFRGVSPALVRELCLCGGVDADAPAAELDDAGWAALHAQWQRWLERVQSHSFAVSTCPRRGAYSVLGAYASEGQAAAAEADGVLRMLGSYYTHLHAHDQFEQMKHRLQRAVTQAVQRLEKKVQSLQKQGGQPDKHLLTQKQADLLMSNVYRCTPGMSSVEVEDWDAPDTLVTIPLDPCKTPVECAEALYRQARKQRRAVEQVAPLVEEAQAQLSYLQEVELMLSQAEEEGRGDMAALRDVQAELVAGGYMKAPPDAALAAKAAAKAKRAQKRAGPAGGSEAGFREYQSPGGLQVLVGRNSRQNDELTMRLARDGDVWMHARGVPGAHVLLRVPAGQEAGQADISYAADLAVWFSKARGEGKADVTTASPADIRKPKGAKPGQVLVTREVVVVGRPHASAAAARGEQD